jgi:hypothetical protein
MVVKCLDLKLKTDGSLICTARSGASRFTVEER